MRQCEQLIIGKMEELQLINTQNIMDSFEMKMNQINGKLD